MRGEEKKIWKESGNNKGELKSRTNRGRKEREDEKDGEEMVVIRFLAFTLFSLVFRLPLHCPLHALSLLFNVFLPCSLPVSRSFLFCPKTR